VPCHKTGGTVERVRVVCEHLSQLGRGWRQGGIIIKSVCSCPSPCTASPAAVTSATEAGLVGGATARP
jgi:hypothetical protein